MRYRRFVCACFVYPLPSPHTPHPLGVWCAVHNIDLNISICSILEKKKRKKNQNYVKLAAKIVAKQTEETDEIIEIHFLLVICSNLIK